MESKNKQIIRLNQEYKEIFKFFIIKNNYTNLEILQKFIKIKDIYSF